MKNLGLPGVIGILILIAVLIFAGLVIYAVMTTANAPMMAVMAV